MELYYCHKKTTIGYCSEDECPYIYGIIPEHIGKESKDWAWVSKWEGSTLKRLVLTYCYITRVEKNRICHLYPERG